MTSIKSTKRALLTSSLSILLCFTMLLGTTFAWFTDSVTSANNVIAAGNLDIEVQYTLDGMNWEALDGADDLFQKSLWEPGHTEVVALKIDNKGSLALKYTAHMNIVKEIAGTNKADEDIVLSKILTVASHTGEASCVTAAFGAEEGLTYTHSGTFYDTNVLGNADGEILASGATQYIVIKVDMAETVGNEGNHKGTGFEPSIEFGINVVAAQLAYESDSFGSDYDKGSTYPAANSVNVPALTPAKITAGEVSIHIPAMANEGNYKLEVSNKSVTNTADGTVATYDISLTRNGEKVDGVTYPVEIEIGKFLDFKSLTHNGEAIAAAYDPATGVVSFETDSFGPFIATYESLGEDIKVSDGKIVGGVFEGVNPAEFDASLAEENSEYIAINYKEGETDKFVVAKRATTVILAAPDTVYAQANGNYNVTTVASNGLYAQISALQNNAFTTVYMLPGTYDVATVVYVYSSMDIIGLGDKNAVRVIKSASSKSNRHIFNCSGTKSDYIEVTIRNMYLDASAKNDLTNFSDRDNAAVQSIRKSKVKCYDLTIIKGTGTGYAFYINANNAVDGVKYPAYMYVENCMVDVTNSAYIRTTNGSKPYFYHTNLTYNNGQSTYTTNSGNTKNQSMAANDWEW